MKHGAKINMKQRQNKGVDNKKDKYSETLLFGAREV